jgi:hypothetical protein
MRNFRPVLTPARCRLTNIENCLACWWENGLLHRLNPQKEWHAGQGRNATLVKYPPTIETAQTTGTAKNSPECLGGHFRGYGSPAKAIVTRLKWNPEVGRERISSHFRWKDSGDQAAILDGVSA